MRAASEASQLTAVLVLAAALRFSFAIPGAWESPWTPHHFDEHILPYEALGLWEGVTPREVGWPAAPSRLALSVAYSGSLIAEEHRALASADNPEGIMAVVALWVGRRIADGAPLYAMGRTITAIFGLLQVVLAMLAARAWLGKESTLFAGVLAAVAPVAVTHSQLVLSDIAGACFTTLLLAWMPRAVADIRLASWLGVLAGLAAASKFHFGIWLLLPLAAYWVVVPREVAARRQRLTATFALVAGFMVTLVAFVPWFWTNAPLALKEFTGVVLAKAAGGTTRTASLLSNGSTVFGGLGVPILAGAILGCRPLLRRRGVLAACLLGVTALSAAILCAAPIVFGRYGLVMLPALILTAAAGWQWMAERSQTLGRVVPIVLLVVGLYQSVQALDEFTHRNSYHLAHEWMIAHLPDRASVVIFSEDNQFLPRTSDQLVQCEAYVESDAAFREKWLTNGVRVPADSGRPMRRAVLNDEFFHAYICARERLAPQSPAFVVHRFHPDRRFQTLDVPTLEREFRAGLADPTRGFDAVLVHWPLFADLQPAATFETPRGPRLQLYLRPALRLRDSLDR